MINRLGIEKVYLACGNTDMRKSIDGLTAIIQECFQLDPFTASIFVFCNRKRDKIKIIQWENNGFWLYYKRLEKGTFKFPGKIDKSTVKIGTRELNWLLDGLTIYQKYAHEKVNAKKVI